MLFPCQETSFSICSSTLRLTEANTFQILRTITFLTFNTQAKDASHSLSIQTGGNKRTKEFHDFTSLRYSYYQNRDDREERDDLKELFINFNHQKRELRIQLEFFSQQGCKDNTLCRCQLLSSDLQSQSKQR